MVKFYESELGEAIKARLKQLEAKPKVEAKVPARRIIEQFKEAARQALAKGYTLAEIRQISQEAGLEVSEATLKTYLRSRKVKKKVAVEKRTEVKPTLEEAAATTPPE